MTEITQIDRQTIEPISTRWSDSTIDVGRVRSELDRLWQIWGTRYGLDTAGTGSDIHEQIYMRPSTVNVIAVTEDDADAARIAEHIGALPDYLPSRSIVLARNSGSSDREFGVRIEVAERRPSRNASPTRVEVFTLMAPPGNDDMLASISRSLLVPDLPDVLFLPEEPFAANPLVTNLCSTTDGVLVDTATSDRVGDTLHFLTTTATVPNRLGLGDLVWTRIRVWRDLVAQFFDHPAAQACLDQIDDGRIVYAPRDATGRSGLTAALLLTGWLASRLGWRAPGELIPTGPGRHRLTLRAGERGRSREVLLHLSEGTSQFSCASLESIRLSSNGDEPSVFQVERVDEAAITTFSRSPHVADMTRLVHSSCPEYRVILAAKMRRLRIDTIYLEALECASRLWPEGFDT
jgi:glucose-6-phosphate dehydrogenase assembly protein OpcA